MAVLEQTTKEFKSGTYNVAPDEVIPQDAASASLGWLTKDGHIELSYGRQLLGLAGAAGKSTGLHVGYTVGGTKVFFRKAGAAIQYKRTSDADWTNVITGLTVTADYVFSNYQSLAGSFVYIFGPDGIYKIATANPGSFASLFSAAINFKGYGFIDKGRTILWGRTEDPTGLYGSRIDPQDGDVYTTVSGEATTSLTGTLAFKAGGATRTCFGVEITITGSGEVYTDNFNGVLSGSLGGTGTINYMTGAYTLSNSGVGTADYQWEDSNDGGVTDFTKSGSRLAGEGFVVRQDAGGDPIMTVIPLDGSYFSLKKNSAYRFELDAEDLNPINEIFRTDIGVPTLRSAVGTSQGIIFLNNANPSQPIVSIIRRNVTGDNFDAPQLFAHYAFDNYLFTDCMVDTWDRFVVISCRNDSDENNTTLLCDFVRGTVDSVNYGMRTSAKADGVLYGGDTVSLSVYELFTGFDDLGISITNFWESAGATYGADVLKKVKRLRFKGSIDPSQILQVYVSYDDDDYQLVGTILGSGDYVDYSASFAIGTTYVGFDTVGGGDTTNVYRYFAELKLHSLKFRKRKIKLVATGIGYVSVDMMTDFDIWTFPDRIPSKYRVKQNVDLSGSPVDEANPDY